MKIKLILTVLCFQLLTLLANAQAPPYYFDYSAVARNSAGQPIASKLIGIEIHIYDMFAPQSYIFKENHVVTTDSFGLFNLTIGTGVMQSGSTAPLADIGPYTHYMLKVSMDTAGGTNFQTIGEGQLLSVPYTMHAKKAGTLSGGLTGGLFSHHIGEEFGGGIIFHLWKDTLGVEHGLIAAKTVIYGTFSLGWSNVSSTLIGATAQGSDGLINSNAIVSQPGHTTSSAADCLNYTDGGYSDWYLPSIQELVILYSKNRYGVNQSLLPSTGALCGGRIDSSTEYNASNKWVYDWITGYAVVDSKQYKWGVIPIRAF